MQIRLMETMFTSTEYELAIEETELHFSSAGGKEIHIPFGTLRQIGLEGENGKRKRLRLETEQGEYEGVFRSEEDEAGFVSQLRSRAGFYVDLRLERLSD